MTETQDLTHLAETGQAMPVLSRNDMLEIIVRRLDERPGDFFRSIINIEGRTLEELRAIRTAGTSLHPAIDALNAAGIETAYTLGALMDVVGFDQDEAHAVACWCNGDRVSCQEMAERFRELKSGQDNEPVDNAEIVFLGF